METPDLLSASPAGAIVRDAGRADVSAIGAIHETSWISAYADVLPRPVLASMPAAALARHWGDAVEHPPSTGHRVLVACLGPTVVGFAAVDPEGEIVALHVAPQHQRRGHGSRLLAACVDHLTRILTATVHVWVPQDDLARRDFFTSAGLGADGAWRDYAVPGAQEPLREIHLIAALTPARMG